MADWKVLLQKVLLLDGKIDAAEAKLIKKEIMSDGVVESDEVDFLVDLRNKAKKCSPEFVKFFFAALSSNLLEDGVIDAAEAKRLRKILLADGKIDADEKKFMKELKKKAKSTCPEFDKLYADCMK
jgi:uncharacterized tellurite resistance protein B-like protein